MTISRRRSNKNSFNRQNLDKKMGQFINVGRQFVDGVAGTRPGKKRRGNFEEFSRRNVNNVGRWVSEKMDTFFEDEYEDDWEDDWEDENQYERDNHFKSFSRQKSPSFIDSKTPEKRPLQAISLRDSRDSSQLAQKELPPKEYFDDEWPDDSDLKIERWRRKNNRSSQLNLDEMDVKNHSSFRNLPKSRRSRI